MVSIVIDELFYSRVEAHYSPQGRSGYQVVYKTSGLSTQDEREIESRIRCFEAEAVSARYQYFALSGGRAVIVISQEITDVDTTITDRTGRRGAFIAHAMVLNNEDFGQLQYNPFFLLESSHFVLDPHSMVEMVSTKPPPRPLDVFVSTEPPSLGNFSLDIGDWSKDEFNKLWFHADDAQNMVRRKQSLLLISSDETTIFETLRLLFSFLPMSQRSFCTFNTYVDGCVPMPGVYWSVGATRQQSNPSFWQARLDEQRIHYKGSNPSADIKSLAEMVYQELRLAQGYEE